MKKPVAPPNPEQHVDDVIDGDNSGYASRVSEIRRPSTMAFSLFDPNPV